MGTMINWDSIEQTLTGMKDVPFAWGTHDCAIVAAEIILQATGQDLLAPVRGLWHDEATAMAVINGPLDLAVDRVTGLARWPVEQSRMLDLCLLEFRGRKALGVNVGNRVAAPGEKGLKLFPMRFVTTCWRTVQ